LLVVTHVECVGQIAMDIALATRACVNCILFSIL
jgi:hypothetical protein